MLYLDVITVVYLTIFGLLFSILGNNIQSRGLGVATLILALANGLKLVGLI